MPTIDPRMDAYIASAAAFAQPLLTQLRAWVHEACPEVVETIKWNMPHFTYCGRNFIHMGAFKRHVGLGLWHGEVRDTPREPGQAMGNFGRISQVADLPSRREMLRLIRSGMAAIEAGAKGPGAERKRTPKPPPEVPAELAQALAADAAAATFFETLPPSARREYTDWIVEAKRDDTRERRIAQTVEQLAEGKRRYWKMRQPC